MVKASVLGMILKIIDLLLKSHPPSANELMHYTCQDTDTSRLLWNSALLFSKVAGQIINTKLFIIHTNTAVL